MWQKDALRRLLAAPDLTGEDLDELVELCKGAPGTVPRPVGAGDFGADAPDPPTVHLLEVSGVRNVNAISSEAPLRIAPQGITVVYGPNGAGKSGYIRLLKQLCRARGGAPAILPNVYHGRPTDPASAHVRYGVGGVEDDCEWREGTDGPESLRRISIFDHECASIYTDENCTVAYLPFGLDLLARLADVCNEVRRRLDLERDRLGTMAMAPINVPPGTEAERFLSGLDREDAREAIERFAEFGADQTARLEALERLLHEQQPGRRAAELDGHSNRLRAFADRLTATTTALSADTATELRVALAERDRVRDALRLASEEAFAAEPLSGTGGPAWKALWEAARRFAAEDARAEGEYPPNEGEECLLCQQPLGDAAADRMRRFEEFVGSDLESRAREADLRVETLQEAMRRAPAIRADEVQPELEHAHGDLYSAVEGLVAGLNQRRDQMADADAEDSLEDLPVLDADTVVERLREIGDTLRAEAEALRRSASEGGRELLESEHGELQGRRRLADRREDLLREIERRGRLRAIANARSTTTTTGITRKNTELTQQYLTADLARSFAETLRELRLDGLPIQVDGAPGERGTAYHCLNLRADATYNVRPGQVLSQGEHRCVALAAFLAEAATQPGASTVILDDPVSLLDHDRRDVVARRLAEIGARRPVLVFTHDMAFALALQRHSDATGVDMRLSRLVRHDGGVGRVDEDLPWHGMNVRRRIGHLRQLHQEAEAIHRRGEQDDYERRVKEIYGFLREAWERAVEEILLNGALERFAPEVQTLRLRRLGEVSTEHMATLEAGMTKSSRWLRGHDDPAGVDDPVPEPDEVRGDIKTLETWRRTLQALHHN